jgi:hypothetical protein
MMMGTGLGAFIITTIIVIITIIIIVIVSHPCVWPLTRRGVPEVLVADVEAQVPPALQQRDLTQLTNTPHNATRQSH